MPTNYIIVNLQLAKILIARMMIDEVAPTAQYVVRVRLDDVLQLLLLHVSHPRDVKLLRISLLFCRSNKLSGCSDDVRLSSSKQ